MSKKEIKYNPRISGKFNFRDFEEYCKAGKPIIYHTPNYVAMDRKTWEEFIKNKKEKIAKICFIDELECDL